MDGERKKFWIEARGHSETASNTHGAECFRLSENVSGLCGLVGRGPSVSRRRRDVRRRLAEHPSKHPNLLLAKHRPASPSCKSVLHPSCTHPSFPAHKRKKPVAGRQARTPARHLPLRGLEELPQLSELQAVLFIAHRIGLAPSVGPLCELLICLGPTSSRWDLPARVVTTHPHPLPGPTPSFPASPGAPCSFRFPGARPQPFSS